MISLLLALFIVWVCKNEYVRHRTNKEETKQMQLLERFIGTVRKNYMATGRVEDSISEAAGDPKLQMRGVAEFVLMRIGTSCLIKNGTVTDRQEIKSSFVLQAFITQCRIALTCGDVWKNGVSCFAKNLSDLCAQLREEMLLSNRAKFLFAGANVITVVPLLFLDPMKRWCLQYLPELSSFYDGIGNALVLITFTVTILIYRLIEILRFEKQRQNTMFFPERIFRKCRIQKILQKHMQNGGIWDYYSDILSASGETIRPEALFAQQLFLAAAAFVIGFLAYLEAVLFENNALHWQEYPVWLLLILMCFLYPVFRVLYKKKINHFQTGLEALQFYSVLLSLIHSREMTVFQMLQTLEEYAVLLKADVRKWIDGYQRIGNKVFQQEYPREQHEMLKRIFDCFAACDSVGIETAFEEMEQERYFFLEKGKIEAEAGVKKKAELVNLLAYIPVSMILGGYLIIPFAVECLRQLRVTTNLL